VFKTTKQEAGKNKIVLKPKFFIFGYCFLKQQIFYAGANHNRPTAATV
jgi:hypothetical protein